MLVEDIKGDTRRLSCHEGCGRFILGHDFSGRYYGWTPCPRSLFTGLRSKINGYGRF